MLGLNGVLAPSLHRESTDSLICSVGLQSSVCVDALLCGCYMDIKDSLICSVGLQSSVCVDALLCGCYMDIKLGSLNLVDLAGSERLGSGVNVTNRLKETQSINKSLSNLGNVIMALANRVSTCKCFLYMYMYIWEVSIWYTRTEHIKASYGDEVLQEHCLKCSQQK